MIQVRRLGGLGAALALVALITCTQVRGGPGKDDELKNIRKSGKEQAGRNAADDNLETDLAATKFAEQKVVVYQMRKDGLAFGWQVKTALKPNDTDERRDRDYLILVDTTASQHGGPLQLAGKLAEAVVKDMRAEDKAAIWTVNIRPKQLTKGFEPKGKLDDALKALANEIPAG